MPGRHTDSHVFDPGQVPSCVEDIYLSSILTQAAYRLPAASPETTHAALRLGLTVSQAMRRVHGIREHDPALIDAAADIDQAQYRVRALTTNDLGLGVGAEGLLAAITRAEDTEPSDGQGDAIIGAPVRLFFEFRPRRGRALVLRGMVQSASHYTYDGSRGDGRGLSSGLQLEATPQEVRAIAGELARPLPPDAPLRLFLSALAMQTIDEIPHPDYRNVRRMYPEQLREIGNAIGRFLRPRPVDLTWSDLESSQDTSGQPRAFPA